MRYQNPRSEYRFLYIGADKLDGYLVLREAKKKTGEAIIADWEATSLVQCEKIAPDSDPIRRFL